MTTDDHVGHGQAPAGFEDPECLAQNGVLVRRQVDHAVRDDHVDGAVGQRNRLDRAFEEFDIRGARLLLILASQCQHLVGHIQPVHLAGRADALGRQQHVDAATRSEIEHRVSRFERQERRRIAAPERRGHGVRRQILCLARRIEVRADRIAAAAGDRPAAARFADGARDGAVFVADRVMDVRI